jgi:peroxiredoxin
MKRHLLILCVTLCACANKPQPLAEGRWRGAFTVGDKEIPFVFEVSGKDPVHPAVTLLNSAERFATDSACYDADTLVIPIRAYDTELRARVSGKHMEGILLKTRSGLRVPFAADRCETPRFAAGDAPKAHLSGKWDVVRAGDEDNPMVGAFAQEADGRVTGSILTTTGDYRYLEGVVQGMEFSLSAFSGMTPYLMKGKFADDDHFTAEFITPTGIARMNGVRNDSAALPDPYALTKLKAGQNGVGFTLPDLDDKEVSFSDERFKNKVVVLSIMGTWCPNCADEADFLAPWYAENQKRGVEVIGLSFERSNDFAQAQPRLKAFAKRHGVGYELLFAGRVGKENVQRVLPALDGFMSYPTLLFVDKKGAIRRIHTGFSGPATGAFYEDFISDFNREINELLNEK